MEIEKSVLGSVRLDSDVWEAVRGMPVSLNVYLRKALLGRVAPGNTLTRAAEDVERHLDAIGPRVSDGRGKASTETWRRGPRQKGDKGR